MSAPRSAFANSLVAMYGSSPETSEDESDSPSPSKLPSGSSENAVDNSQASASCPDEVKEPQTGNIDSMNTKEDESGSPKSRSSDVPEPQAAAPVASIVASDVTESESIDDIERTSSQETSISKKEDMTHSDPELVQNTKDLSSEDTTKLSESNESERESEEVTLFNRKEAILSTGSVTSCSLQDSCINAETTSEKDSEEPGYKASVNKEINELITVAPQDLTVELKENSFSAAVPVSISVNVDYNSKAAETSAPTEDEEIDNLPSKTVNVEQLNLISESPKVSESVERTDFVMESLCKIDLVNQANVQNDSECAQLELNPIITSERNSLNKEASDSQHILEKPKKSSTGEKNSLGTPAGRRLRQIRHPSAKAAEAAADAAFVAAVTPTRKNLKEAKIASALAKVTDSPDVPTVSKKASISQSSIRVRKGRSSSLERTSINLDSRTSPLIFSTKEDSSSSETASVVEGKLTAINEDVADTDSDAKEEIGPSQSKSTGSIEGEKPLGIKLKISKESVQILDPSFSRLEVQIPTEAASSEFTCSPGGTKRLRKLKECTLSPNPPLSPITLKIAKSKEGLEVVSTENISQIPSGIDSEVAKVEKITLKLSQKEGATIVKSVVEEVPETKPEKLTLKLVKDEGSQKFTSVHSQDDVEEAKLGKIFLKLSKGDNACIVKRKEADTGASSTDTEAGKLERITFKRSMDNNVSIVRSKDVAQLERSASASPDPGKIEKITLKVSKNDNISIVKPASPTPSALGVEKLTLKVSKDGTAAVAAKQNDDFSRDGEGSKLEKITIKLSKEDGVSIVKPASPVPDKKSFKLIKDEPLSPLSPLTISRSEEVEPQKERITLKLSKAGGHPSPVGITDERSSWSIKSTDSDTVPSPVPFDPATPKLRQKRGMIDTPETTTSSAKRLKLSDLDKSDDSNSVPAEVAVKREECEELTEEGRMDIITPQEASQPDPEFEEATPAEEVPIAPTEDSMEVILLDSEDSQNDTTLASESSQPCIPIIDIENEIPTTKIPKRKPRGRPRKSVLTPGAIPIEIRADSTAEDSGSPPKPKRERVRPEPAESDRPKRSCKGREKPPPKPAKPTKPRGRAALAKQKAEQSMQPEEPQLFEEETRMSADCGSQSETPTPNPMISVGNGLIAKVMVSRLTNLDKIDQSTPTTPSETPADSPVPLITNEESQASQGSVSMVSSTTESTPNRGNRKGRMEINVDPDAHAEFTVDMVAEYLWPLNDGQGETYMIQEQISSYLGVKSFKRKYPNMQRRAVDHDERQYLLERKLVSESLCDLGLTALPSHEVLDVLCTDFPEKFDEYRRFTRERVQKELSSKQKALLTGGPPGKEDSKSKAMRNMASFNAMLNRSRRDQRRCCFDLQSFTVHYPEERRRRMSVPNLPHAGPYPLALVPGQFTDFYKEYTPAELRYFPLNTVLYGPLLPDEIRLSAGGSDGSQTDSSDSSSSDSSSSDSDSSGSDSDSDSDSSSESGDDSSCQVVTGTVESQEGEVDRPDAVCRVCTGDRLKNKIGLAEPLVHCASCEKSGHLSCLDLTVDMMSHIRKYAWHCTDCKLCAQCHDTADEDKMLFCDMCDRGYHIYCVGLRKVPEGRWHCQECAVCASCAARDPGGTDTTQTQSQSSQDTPTKTEAPQWQHEFKKGDKGARIYVRTLCVPCSKLWKKGRYCRLCWKCFTNQPEEEGLINCSICDRWMHADCCRKAGRVIDVEKISSYICELCQLKGVRVSANKSPVKLLR